MTENGPPTGPRRSLSALLEQMPAGLILEGGSALPPLSVRGVTEDSRQVGREMLFVAVPGLNRDGHSFIPQALSAGAAAVVGSRSQDRLRRAGWWPQAARTPYLQTTDSREALAWLSASLHRFPSRDQTVVGVTGTDGKTTTCAVLEAILGCAAAVGVVSTVGARIGGVDRATGLHVTTPDAPTVQAFLARMRSAACRYAIIESTSFGLEQKRVASVEFDVAALTNITHEHLDVHGSFEAYREAKFTLFRSLFRRPAQEGTPRLAVFNRDDSSYQPLVDALAEEEALGQGAAVRSCTYSVSDCRADVYARNIAYLPDATRFDLVWRKGVIPMETRLLGEFNVSNILCAAAAALGLGIGPGQIRRGVSSLSAVLGRMQRIDAGQDFLAVVDFAHSPASLERALQTLRPLVGSGSGNRAGRLISIFGCAGLRDRGKRRLMGRISGRLADFTIITAEDPRTEDLDAINGEIAAGIRETAGLDAASRTAAGSGGGDHGALASEEGLPPSPRFAIVPDRREAIRIGIQIAGPGDVVASFGKGHERSICFGETEYPWNEQEAMLAALQDRRAVVGVS